MTQRSPVLSLHRGALLLKQKCRIFVVLLISVVGADKKEIPRVIETPGIFHGGRYRTRFAFLLHRGKKHCSHQCLHWWQELSPGQFLCYGFESYS